MNRLDNQPEPVTSIIESAGSHVPAVGIAPCSSPRTRPGAVHGPRASTYRSFSKSTGPGTSSGGGGGGYECVGSKLLKERRREGEMGIWDDLSVKNNKSRVPVDLILRSIRKEDLQDVMRLHSILFPVQYNEKFYDRLFLPNVFTALAFVQSSPPRLVGIATGRVTYANGDPVDLVPPMGGWEIQIGDVPPFYGKRHSLERLGAVRGRSRKETVTGYVMTLGAMPEVRNLGLGTILLQTLTNFFVRQAYVDRMELDVLTENIPAVKFYLKHGFFVAERKNGYYAIDGKHYDSYQMIFNPYFHITQPSQRQRSYPWRTKSAT